MRKITCTTLLFLSFSIAHAQEQFVEIDETEELELKIDLSILGQSEIAEESIEQPAQRYECTDFKLGEFRYVDEHQDVKVTRTKKYQIEESADKKLKLKIKWISNCEYTLTLIEASDEKDKALKGKTMYCEIILIDGSTVTVTTRFQNSKFTTKMKKIS